MDPDTVLSKEKRSEVRRGARLLREGGLVVFPTETVYGIGADARNSVACERIYQAKGRPSDNPLIVHIASRSQLRELCAGEPPEAALRALELFAPGPITVVVRHNGSISKVATTGLTTVALRIPAHPLALALLREAAIPVAAPSANRSGRPSPTTYPMALGAMEGRVELIIDGGECDVGVESTILDCTTTPQRILRPGGITREMLQEAGFRIAPPPETGRTRPFSQEAAKGADVATGGAPAGHHRGEERHPPSAGREGDYRAPGSRYRHYRPEAAVHLLEEGDPGGRGNAFLQGAEPRTVALIGTGEGIDSLQISSAGREALLETVRFESLDAFARGIFSSFHSFDEMRCRAILAVLPPASGLGVAIRDRLGRAGNPL